MSSENFLLVWGPENRGYLRRSLLCMKTSASSTVPNVDGSIIRSATGCKEVGLPGTPSKPLIKLLERADEQGTGSKKVIP